MIEVMERPFAGKTDGELFLISEFTEREIKTLTEKNDALKAEMKLRSDAAGAGKPVLEYRDSYQDRSRRYAIKMAFIAMAIAVVIFICLAMYG